MNSSEIEDSIIARFMNGEIEPEAAARELAALPSITWDANCYWSEELYHSGEVERRMSRLLAELKRLGIEPPAA